MAVATATSGAGNASPIAGARNAAGILFMTEGGEILLLRRSGTEENYGGHWALPGGSSDPGETPEQTARREAIEEMGQVPFGAMRVLDERETPTGMVFTTFLCRVPDRFTPTLNFEHSGHLWTAPGDLPSPMHPAVKRTLASRPLTLDRAPGEADHLRFYTPVKLGPRQSLTPEGFLLCEDVPIARTGELLYLAGEVPVEPGRDGLIRITRDEMQVFSPETIASFLGKPVTDDHPDEDVTPSNWRRHSVGTIVSVRRGTDAGTDFLLADLLIQDAEAIEAVRAGKREVSCGYDADYEQIEPGKGRQTNIVGNHVALVDKGRCGPRCAIGDRQPSATKGGPTMAKRTWRDRIRTAFKAQDEDALNEELDAVSDENEPQRLVIEVKQPDQKVDEETTDEGEGTADPVMAKLEEISAAIVSLADRVTKLEGAAAGEPTADDDHKDDDDTEETRDEDVDNKDDEDDEKSGKTTDSAGLKSEFTDTLARAEILSPGIKLPTFDAKANAKKTGDSLCALRRKALAAALKDDDRKEFVSPFVSGKAEIEKLTCDAAKAAFVGASELAKRATSRATVDHRRAATDAHSNSIKSINEANRAFWSR